MVPVHFSVRKLLSVVCCLWLSVSFFFCWFSTDFLHKWLDLFYVQYILIFFLKLFLMFYTLHPWSLLPPASSFLFTCLSSVLSACNFDLIPTDLWACPFKTCLLCPDKPAICFDLVLFLSSACFLGDFSISIELCQFSPLCQVWICLPWVFERFPVLKCYKVSGTSASFTVRQPHLREH